MVPRSAGSLALHAISVALVAAGTGLVAGCGQKGPLTLPATPAASASAPAPQATR